MVADDATLVGILDDPAIIPLGILALAAYSYIVINANDLPKVMNALGKAIVESKLVQQTTANIAFAQAVATVIDDMIKYRARELDRRLRDLKKNVCQVKCKTAGVTNVCPYPEIVGIAGHLSPKIACLEAMALVLFSYPGCVVTGVDYCTETTF